MRCQLEERKLQQIQDFSLVPRATTIRLHIRCLTEDVRALYARFVEERGYQRTAHS